MTVFQYYLKHDSYKISGPKDDSRNLAEIDFRLRISICKWIHIMVTFYTAVKFSMSMLHKIGNSDIVYMVHIISILQF